MRDHGGDAIQIDPTVHPFAMTDVVGQHAKSVGIRRPCADPEQVAQEEGREQDEPTIHGRWTGL